MLYEYDATNERCPLPLVKTRVILKKMKENDVCILRLADSGSKSDIPRLLKKQNYDFQVTQLDTNEIEIKISGR
mgnify:FL=1